MKCGLAVSFSFMVLILGGCHKRSHAPVPPPPQATTPVPIPTAPPPLVSPVNAAASFETAETNFEKGNYVQSAREFEAYLSAYPKSLDRDRALFHLGMARALGSDSTRDLRQAEAAFKRLAAEFPGSPYKNQAEFILGLQAQIERLKADVKEREARIQRLTDELQKLKEIDMRQRPSRPPDN
jgi:hypothetical protein